MDDGCKKAMEWIPKGNESTRYGSGYEITDHSPPSDWGATRILSNEM